MTITFPSFGQTSLGVESKQRVESDFLDKSYPIKFPITEGTRVAVEMGIGHSVYICGIEHNIPENNPCNSGIKGTAPGNWRELLKFYINPDNGETDTILVSYLPDEVAKYDKIGTAFYSDTYINPFFKYCQQVVVEAGKKLGSADIAHKPVYEFLELLFAGNPIVPVNEILEIFGAKYGVQIPKFAFTDWFAERWNRYTGHGFKVTNRELMKRFSPNDARRLLQADALLKLSQEGKTPTIICAPAHAERIYRYLQILKYEGSDSEMLEIKRAVERKLNIYKGVCDRIGLSNDVRYVN